MKKVAMKFFGVLALAVGIAACGGGNAFAQGSALNHMQFASSTRSNQAVDLWAIRKINATPGANSITDPYGVVISGTLPISGSASWTGSDAGRNILKRPGTDEWYQLANAAVTYCDAGGNTVIQWKNGAPETLADACVFAIYVSSASRR